MARAARTDEIPPAHDALEGVPLPRETPFLVGHAAAERALLEAYRSGRMHHAWLLSGDRGIGRATLAFRLARFALAHPDGGAEAVGDADGLDVPAEHPAARRVAAGSHANVLHLERDWDDKARRFRTEIRMETVRRIIPFLGTTAGEGGWRFVIVDPADDLNHNAANALLKAVEEPPPKTVFLIVCGSAGRLLPTIRSRCRKLRLEPLSSAETAAVAARLDPSQLDRPDAGLALALASGSPRRFVELMRDDGVALYRLLLAAVEGGDRRAMTGLAAGVADVRGGALERFMELFLGYLHRRVRGLAEPAVEAAPPGLPLATWTGLWEKATLSGREVEAYNLDRKQFVLDLLETTAAAVRQHAIPVSPTSA